MYDGYADWRCAQNEAIYIRKLYPYATIMQQVYTSRVVPSLAGIPVGNLKGEYGAQQKLNSFCTFLIDSMIFTYWYEAAK
jgi:hypothetical protein